MTLIDLTDLLQRDLALILPILLNSTLILLGVRQAQTARYPRKSNYNEHNTTPSSSNSKPNKARVDSHVPSTSAQTGRQSDTCNKTEVAPDSNFNSSVALKGKGKGLREARVLQLFGVKRVKQSLVLQSKTWSKTSPAHVGSHQFKGLTKRDLEDFMDPPGCTGRRLYKINRHIRLVIKMLTKLEKDTKALQRFSPNLIDDRVFDNVVWELCLTKGFLFDLFGRMNAFMEHYLSVTDPDTKVLQSLYNSKLVTHKVVCLPRRGSEIEGAWELNDNFSFERFDNGLSRFESRNTRLPLDFFWCWINDELVCPKVADCHFFIEQIDPIRKFRRVNLYVRSFSPEEILTGDHEESDSEDEDEVYDMR